MNRSRILLPLVFGCTMATIIGCSGTRQATLPPGADQPNVVAVIDDELFTLADFEERYLRTAGGRDSARDDSLGAYVDFLDRYVNFRLKVMAARAAGLDRDPEILQEIETYRKNLARPYLIDREVIDPLVRQMYDRQSEMIDASHILIRLDEEATPADTLAAYERLSVIRDSIVAGADFAEMAARHSEDPSARRAGAGSHGRLGYFTAGRMIAEFEDMAYATPEGEVSPIFRTVFGYHILKVEDRMESQPERLVAHIMIVPEPDSLGGLEASMDTIRHIQSELAAGVPFEELARRHSDDRRSAAQGGSLPPITYQAPLPRTFLDAAYAINEEGDVSDVVETSYGYHLIKLLEIGSRPTYDESYEELKREVARLPRAKLAEEQFARGLWANYGGTVDTAAVVNAVTSTNLDSLLTQAASNSLPASMQSLQIAQLGDSTYTLGGFLSFAQDRGIRQDLLTESGIKQALAAYAADEAIAFETAALESRNAEFGRVMTEFREGLILFSLMEDSVWTAASEDTLALQAHWETRKDSYRFPERTRVVAFYSPSDSLLKDLAMKIEDGVAGAALQSLISADSTLNVRIDTVRIAEATNSVFDQALSLEVGSHVGPVRHSRDWVLLLKDGIEAPRVKTFEEARANVVSEYQELLEEALISRLREKYDVYVFPERLQTAFGRQQAEPQPVSVRP